MDAAVAAVSAVDAQLGEFKVLGSSLELHALCARCRKLEKRRGRQ